MSYQTRLGEFLEKKSVNKASVGRKAGLSKNRMTAITTSDTARLTAEELYLVALAIGVSPGDLLDFVCEGMKLKEEE